MNVDNSNRLPDGLWRNNPALVQLLGLCPLLAVSNSAINGLGLGLATLLTLVLSNTLVSATRRFLIHEIRIPVFVILIAGIVTCVGILMNAYAHDIYLQLGIFIPLIITNCMILARAEAFASRHNISASIRDALLQGFGFAAVLLTIGTLRELVGTGGIFANRHLIFGSGISAEPLITLHIDRGFLIALLPPGAFIFLGLLIAGKNLIDKYLTRTNTHGKTSNA